MESLALLLVMLFPSGFVLAQDINALEMHLKRMLANATRNSSLAVSLGVSLPDDFAAVSGPGRQPNSIISIVSGKRVVTQADAFQGHCPQQIRGHAAPRNAHGHSAPRNVPADCAVPTDTFAMGSATKMYTAAAVLRLVEQGKFGLDDKALPLFDKLWTRLNGTSIVNGLGSQIKDVTVRQLLQMQSGIPDFDNDASRQYQFKHPHEDLGPVEEMSFLFPSKGFVCQPGTCGKYSSSNYELLGLILAQQAGKESWDEYDQAAGLNLSSIPGTGHTRFAVHGPCSEYTKVHAYSCGSDCTSEMPPLDMYNVSCTNGWTCGNLITNAAGAAAFVRALLGKGNRILSEASQKEMLKFRPITKGFGTGLGYGLGVMDMGAFSGTGNSGSFVGHAGATYGFSSYTGYVKDLDFGISVVSNSESEDTNYEVLALAVSEVAKHLTRPAPPVVMV